MHKDGVLQIEGLISGRHLIGIAPSGRHAGSEWQAIDLPAPRGQALRFALLPRVDAEFQVMTVNGKPVEGSTVELLEAESRLPIDPQT